MSEEFRQSQALMERVGNVVSGMPSFDIMMVFAWIIGDMIVQTESDAEAVMADFLTMVVTAISLGKQKPEMTLQ